MGTYLELDRPRRLVFTWGIGHEAGDSSRVAVDLVAERSGCVVHLRHELHSDRADYVARVTESWTKMLGCLRTGVFKVRKIKATSQMDVENALAVVFNVRVDQVLSCSPISLFT